MSTVVPTAFFYGGFWWLPLRMVQTVPYPPPKKKNNVFQIRQLGPGLHTGKLDVGEGLLSPSAADGQGLALSWHSGQDQVGLRMSRV